MDEKIMRTSVFGGFKKEDVLSFVESLQKDIEALKAEITQKNGEIEELKQNIEALNSKSEELDKANGELQQAQQEIDALKEENETLTQKSAALSEIADEYVNVKSQLEKEQNEIKEAQARLGAAFTDARKYSENIVAAANEKAYKTSVGFSQDISRQAGEITKLSDEIDKISAEFNNTANSLHANIAVIAQRMSAASMNLQQRNETDFKPSLNASFEVDDDATGIINTDDGSGLTFIQYPPHTRFNEDLDLKPLEAQDEA